MLSAESQISYRCQSTVPVDPPYMPAFPCWGPAVVHSPSVALPLSTHGDGAPGQGPVSPGTQASCPRPPAGAQSLWAVGGRGAGHRLGLHGSLRLCGEAGDSHHRQGHQGAECHHQPPLATQLSPEPRRLGEGVEKENLRPGITSAPTHHAVGMVKEGPSRGLQRGESGAQAEDTPLPLREAGHLGQRSCLKAQPVGIRGASADPCRQTGASPWNKPPHGTCTAHRKGLLHIRPCLWVLALSPSPCVSPGPLCHLPQTHSPYQGHTAAQLRKALPASLTGRRDSRARD